MRIIPSLIAWTITTAAAQASGGISCTQASGEHVVDIGAGVTHGMGGPVFELAGHIEVADPSAAPDLARTTFTREHLAQYWLDGRELRLLLYREREGDAPHGYAELTILTEADDDEETYAGTYALTLFDTVDGESEGRTLEYAGAVSCSVE